MAMTTGRSAAEINVTPFIDVLLVLMIIFMLQVGRTVLPVQVARDGAPGRPAPQTLVLELTNTGGYRLNTVPVPAESLAAVLHNVFSVRQEKVLFVRAGSQRLYGETMAAIDVARGAGVEVVALAP